MKKPAIIAVMVLTGFGSLSSPANAGDGGAVAAGVIGGLAIGALAGAAAADANRAPEVVYGGRGYVRVYRPRRRVYVYRYEGPAYYESYPDYDYDAYSYRFSDPDW